jgi:1-acyl-sn-glycerol-3-phosphate acyltransferase
LNIFDMPKHDDRTRRSLPIQFFQGWVRWFFRTMLTLTHGLRVYNVQRYPRDGGVLVCANHQSNLDPLILGSVFPRPVNYLAKKQLFEFGPLGWFLRWNDAIPIDRESSGIGGMKETLKRLKKREAVLMFPEGTRSKDGSLLPMKRGFLTIAKRTKVPVLPVGFDGAFQSWPKDSLFPGLGDVRVVIGQPVPFEEYSQLSEDEFSSLLETRIEECFVRACKLRGI